jgi:hydrogenase expression/formation protein HypE
MNIEFPNMQGPVCPLPISHWQQILMGHGSGGKMSHDLITEMFLPAFDNPSLNAGDDAGVVQLSIPDSVGNFLVGSLSISTDSHVVWPLFFPGGDIGRLAVCGTVNDVAMMGANPLYMTAGFILEEGLDISILARVVASMQTAATEAGISIVAGDTKVVQKGKADGLYINTAGIGVIPPGISINGSNAHPGDAVLLSGPIGDHGIAVLEARQELGFESKIESDTAPLNHLIEAMLGASRQIHVLRDPTRGGLATSLNEIARQSEVGILLYEENIPVKPAVATACEMLGFDPMYIANEGKLVAIVDQQDAENVLQAMRKNQYGQDAVLIGEVRDEPKNRVLMRTTLGSTRVVDIPTGEILPRIC